jgi:flagellar hook-basal body complex protein FliE
MSLGALDAAAAYGRTLGTSNIGTARPGGASTPSIGGGEDTFGAMVEGLVTNAADSMRTAETATAQQVAGRGDLIDVITAIGAAETALDTVVAVRDRVVNAYSEIMRMQI